MAKICVMAMGNVLTGDDAIGPFVLDAIERNWEFPPGVEVMDLGTPGIDLTMFLTDVDALVIIDAVNAAGEPGEVRTYRRDALVRHAPAVRTSTHEPTLREALLRLDFLGAGPREVLLVGAIPATLETGAPISERVRRAVPELVRLVIDECTRLGYPPRRREEVRPADWRWDRPTADAEAR